MKSAKLLLVIVSMCILESCATEHPADDLPPLELRGAVEGARGGQLSKTEFLKEVLDDALQFRLINTDFSLGDPESAIMGQFGKPDYSKIFPFMNVHYFHKADYLYTLTTLIEDLDEKKPLVDLSITSEPFFAQKITIDDMKPFYASFPKEKIECIDSVCRLDLVGKKNGVPVYLKFSFSRNVDDDSYYLHHYSIGG